MAHLAKLSNIPNTIFSSDNDLSDGGKQVILKQQLSLTEIPTNISPPTRTIIPTGGVPTTLPITQIAPPTSQSLVLPPTSISLPPTFAQFPTNTPTPISIVILSPIPGNVVAGNVQVLGAQRFIHFSCNISGIRPLILMQAIFGIQPQALFKTRYSMAC